VAVGLTDFIIQQVRRSKRKKAVRDPAQFGNIRIEPIINEVPLQSPAENDSVKASENATN
ncbi:MAG: hypothetical protein ACRC5H_06210, partial [Treponemataceae bacterium]